MLCGYGRFTLPALGLGLVEQVPEQMPAHTREIAALGEQLGARLRALIGDGVLLYPSLPTLAPPHHGLLLRIWDAGATGLFNVLQLPATAVPMGLSSDGDSDDSPMQARGRGLPVGLQVVGAEGADLKTIAVAQALQRTGLAHWTPPP